MDILGPIASIGSGLINFFSGKSNNDDIAWENTKNRQYDWTKFQTSIGYQDKWRKEDKEWNSYANQRRLLTDAGYNPNALFNSASMLSSSNGSASAPSGGAPSVGYPSPSHLQFDPGLINVIADAKLKEKQADNIEADTKKKESETEGQGLQNEYQKVANSIFKLYGEEDFKLGMNFKDAQRAVFDAQRLVLGVQQSLYYDELFNMRPKEALKLVAETNASNASSLLSKAQAAKTEDERLLLSKRFALETLVANSTVALNYANAYYSRTQADLWQPNFDINGKTGILFRKSFIETNQARFNYRKSNEVYDATFEAWKDCTINTLKAHGLYNANLASALEGFWGNAYQSLMRNLSFIPGSSTASSSQPLGFISAPF